MSKIYIVMGRAGSYSDMEEWPVAAYLTVDRADNLIALAQRTANRIIKKIGKLEENRGFHEKKEQLLKTNAFDPDMKGSIWSDDTEYWLMEVELRD